MTDKSTKCTVCSGRGSFRCGCWPADCICGQEEETCWECNGDGWLDPSDDPFDGHYGDTSPPAPLQTAEGS